MNKNLIAITICFLLVIGILITAGYVLNTDLKHENQSLQSRISDMQKEIDGLKEYAGTLAGQHIGAEGVEGGAQIDEAKVLIK